MVARSRWGPLKTTDPLSRQAVAGGAQTKKAPSQWPGPEVRALTRASGRD